MSGSPVVLSNGTAVGVVTLGASSANPRLYRDLPGWMLHAQNLDPSNSDIASHA
jgi:hypothetical protein